MGSWAPSRGETLLVPSGPSGEHLFLMLLGPAVLPGYGPNPQVAMASITSIRTDIPFDGACILQPGEHPFVQHPSYVAYRYLRLDGEPHIARMVASSVWRVHQPCAPLLLQRVVDGVCKSKLTPREYKRIFGCP